MDKMGNSKQVPCGTKHWEGNVPREIEVGVVEFIQRLIDLMPLIERPLSRCHGFLLPVTRVRPGGVGGKLSLIRRIVTTAGKLFSRE